MFQSSSSSAVLTLIALATLAQAHMSIWVPTMYGAGPNYSNVYLIPANPLGPGWEGDQWWFRGPQSRSIQPVPRGTPENLPAGGTWTVEIACHVAWTSYGTRTTTPGSALDACPGNTGAYHAGDPSSPSIDTKQLGGCALGIADVDDISKVTVDNLVIFSVQKDCVKQKMTSFQIPAAMPACTGARCICAWFWLANNGTANFYMTGFDCKVTNVSPFAKKISLPPSNPIHCPVGSTTCKPQAGAKRPLYAYNNPTNVDYSSTIDRPNYSNGWSFSDGPQNDIFVSGGLSDLLNTTKTTTTSQSSTTVTTTSVKTSTTTLATTTRTTSSSTAQTTTTTQAPASTQTTTSKAVTTTTTAASGGGGGGGLVGGVVVPVVGGLLGGLRVKADVKIGTTKKSSPTKTKRAAIAPDSTTKTHPRDFRTRAVVDENYGAVQLRRRCLPGDRSCDLTEAELFEDENLV